VGAVATGAAGPDAPTLVSAALPAASLPVGPRESRPAAGRALRWGWITLAFAVAALAAAIAVVRRPMSHLSSGRAAPAARAEAPPTLPSPAMTAPASQPLSSASDLEPIAAPSVEAQPTQPPATRVTHRAQVAMKRRAPAAPEPLPTISDSASDLPTPVPVEPGKRTPPAILEQAPLLLSRDLLAAHHSESIGVVAIVAADGSLKEARVISPVCPECDRAALEALRRSRFRAAMDPKGRPVEGAFAFRIRIP